MLEFDSKVINSWEFLYFEIKDQEVSLIPVKDYFELRAIIIWC